MKSKECNKFLTAAVILFFFTRIILGLIFFNFMALLSMMSTFGLRTSNSLRKHNNDILASNDSRISSVHYFRDGCSICYHFY